MNLINVFNKSVSCQYSMSKVQRVENDYLNIVDGILRVCTTVICKNSVVVLL